MFVATAGNFVLGREKVLGYVWYGKGTGMVQTTQAKRWAGRLLAFAWPWPHLSKHYLIDRRRRHCSCLAVSGFSLFPA